MHGVLCLSPMSDTHVPLIPIFSSLPQFLILFSPPHSAMFGW